MKDLIEHGGWLPEVLEKIKDMIHTHGCGGKRPGREGPLAVFDLDQTCIKGDIGYTFFFNMVENVLFRHRFEPFRKFFMQYNAGGRAEAVLKMLGEPHLDPPQKDEMALMIHDLYRAIRDEMGDGECFRWMAGLLLGWRHEEVREEAVRLLGKELETELGEKILAQKEGRKWVVPSGIRIYQEMENLIDVLDDNGFDVWIISATSQPIVEAAAGFLGVPRRRCIGVRHETENGILVSTAENVTYGKGKVEAIKKIIGRKPLFAAGDWYTDLEMLGFCDGLSLLLDRGREDLVRYGKGKGWLVQPVFGVQ